MIASNNIRSIILEIKGILMQIQKLTLSSSSYKNNVLKVSHYNTVYFLRYTHQYLWNVCLETYRNNGILLKLAYFLRKNTNFTGK